MKEGKRTNYRVTGVPLGIGLPRPPPVSPASKERCLAKLRKLLELADRAFKSNQQPEFPNELLELPELIAQLQTAIGKTASYRVPFWKCVVALDHHYTGLALVATLDDLVKRACSISPGPLVQLINLDANRQLAPNESAVLSELKKIDEDDLAEMPLNPMKFANLLNRVASAEYKKYADPVIRHWPPSVRPPQIDAFLAFALYRDFVWQHFGWLEHYLPALEPFALLLAELQNEDYDRQRNRILFGDVRSEVHLKTMHAKAIAAARQRRYQEKLREGSKKIDKKTTTPRKKRP